MNPNFLWNQQLFYITTCQPICLQISLEAKGAEAFQTPRGCCVPFGVMELALAALPYEQQDRYKQLLATSETAGLAELTGISDELQVGL
jgi:hypothetical protein